MPDTIGNDFSTAKKILPIVSPQLFSEFIGVEAGVLDGNDYYTFTLNRSSSVTLSLTGLGANANLEVRNSAGAIVTDTDGIVLSSTNTGTLTEAINAILGAGTYYVRVFPGQPSNPSDPLTTPSTTYNLNIAADNNAIPGIVWRNYATGANSIWAMNGATLASFDVPIAVGDTNWRIQATGNFNNDNSTDIVWRNYATGQNVIWIMNGGTLNSAVILDPAVADLNWEIVGTGDFNSDSRTDILWRNQLSGENVVWFMNGTAFSSLTFIESFPSNYKLQGTADFNNDGYTDLVWRNFSTESGQGQNIVWFMNGTTRVNSANLPDNSDLNWDIAGAGDYNRDGKADILWRNRVNGLTTIWFMNGTTLQSFSLVSPAEPIASPDWRAVGPFDRFGTPVRADLAGNNTSSTLRIGPLNGTGAYNDFAGTTDINDYYQFSLGSPTSLILSLTGVNGGSLQGDLDVQILNSAGLVATVGTTRLEAITDGNGNEQIQTPAGENLTPGTYFVRVFAKAGANSFYRLNLEANNLPVLATRNNLTLSEGTTATIGSTLLSVIDANNTPDQLVFTLTDPPDNGSLSLDGAAIGTGNVFTQAAINAGRLTYGQNGSETLTDTFIFSVSDGTAIGTLSNQTFTINVTPVNDLPTLISNTTLAITEGTAATINGTQLLVTDTEQGAAEITYSLNSTPLNGFLLLAGTTLTTGATFTQADVTAGNRLSYQHNGSETTSDRFTFTVRDIAGGVAQPAPSTFSIAVTALNDPPTLITNAGLTLNQDQSSVITSSVLRVTDPEFNTSAGEDQIFYTVTTLPTRGTLFLNGTQSNTFTQGDLNNGRVLYDHDGSPTNSDRFTFTVRDDLTSIGPFTFNVTVNAVNFAPALTSNNPLVVSEGVAATIGQTLLQTTDRDTPPPSLLYTLTSAPSNGQLRRDNSVISVGQTFSQSDIDNSRLTYLHNGSETTNDVFTFNISDSTGNSIPNQTFTVNVLPANDPPILATNTGLTIAEGAEQTIGTSLLQVTDVDNLLSQITYSIVGTPSSGTLLLAGTAGPTTFTQSDINNGLLRYQHNGSESTADSFTFNVSDGTASLGLRTFNIAVSPVNDPPVVATNTPLTLNEGATAAINNTLTTRLLVTDDDGANTVTLTLAQAPTRGQLLRGNTTLTSGQLFTPADLSTLTYTHNGSETTSDSFVFSGSDGATGVLSPTTFTIAVTPVNDLPVLISNPGLSLSEGGTVQIINTLLLTTDAETTIPGNIRYTVTAPPTNGTLLLSGVQSSTFTQADINNGLVQYRHRGTETISDSFTFDVTDGTQALTAQVVNIAIAPVNDNPTILNNEDLSVTEGAPPVLIDDSVLLLTDNDGPGPLVYTLVSIPTSGRLLLGTTPLSVGQSFTQDQINNDLLRYANNGSETTSDQFTFTASDSSTGSLGLTTFTIGITPADDPPVLVSNVGLSLTEGGITTISNTLLLITDAETPLANNILYTITQPQNGTVLLAGTQTTTFTQADINTGLVRYQHNGGETIADNFTFSVTAGASNLANQTFNIAVTPVNDNPGLALSNGLSISEGDAPTLIPSTSLQLTDNDGPGPLIYTLVSTPTSGSLLLSGVSLSAGQTFSQAEINNNQLFYANNGSETTRDRFTFTASDGSTGVLPLTTFSIAIAPVGDIPVLTSNNGLTLGEGGQSQISSSLLSATDAETPLPSNLTYNVAGGTPTNGTLLRAGTAVNSFTQADINNGLIFYRHFGTETVSDSFTFNVTDGSETLPSQVFNITVTPVNDAPGISTTANLFLPVTEGGPAVTITTTNLQITDNDGPGPLSYTITTAPTRGTLLLAGTTPLTSGQTFTQDDIDSGRLSYRHNGSETTTDSFTFTASDGSTGTIPSTVFSIGVTPANDAPILTVPGALSVNEDTALAFTGANAIQVRDVDNTSLSLTFTTTTGRFSINPGSLIVNGNGTNSLTINNGALTAINTALSSLTFQGDLNFNGPASIEIVANDGALTDTRTIDVTVIPVNDAPTLTVAPGTVTVNEDTLIPIPGITVTDVDSDTNPVQAIVRVNNGGLTIGNTTGITFEATENGAGTLTLSGAIASIQTALASLGYQGNPDYFGTDTLTILVDDLGGTGTGGARTVTRTIPISVTSVNDRPTFTPGSDITVLEDAGARTIPGWATNILPGPANESSQIVNFTLTNDNNGLFLVQPTVSSNGTLSFTPAANANGSATVTAILNDNGGGTNTSIPVIFTISVTPVNDAPSFTIGPSQIIAEDAGLRTVNNWATAISAGPADEAGQSLTFEVDTTNPSLFAIAPTVSPTGTLVYQVAPDANGTATVTVRLRDDGGTANGGVDASTLRTFTITANAVNDAPILTVPGAQVTNEDETLTITGVSFTDVDADPRNLQVRLTALNGVIGITNTPGVTLSNNNVSNITLTGSSTALTTALSSFTYRGNPNFEGPSDTLTITVSDLGNTGSGGTLTDTDTIAITVNAVNDAPTVTVPTNVLTIQEDTDLVLTGLNVTDLDAGAGSVQFTISALNGTLNFANTTGLPTVIGNGTSTVTLEGTLAAIRTALTTASNLRYRGNLNYNGPDTVTVTFNDQGNTGSGGSLSDTRSFSVNVTAVNDLPTLTLPVGPLALNEDDPTGLVFTQGTPTEILLTDVDSGNNQVRVSLLVNRGTLNLPSTSGLTPVSGANGTNTFTFTGTINNIIAALNNLNYRSNTNFNGQDVLTITVNDQGNTGSGVNPAPNVVRSLTINVTSANDAPVLVSNRGLTLNEGDTRTILSSLLNTTDADALDVIPTDTPDQIIYTLVNRPNPANGSLQLVNGATTLTLANSNTFTQADINAGRLRYVHSGSESPTDSFTFRVSDGDITIPDIADTYTFNVRIAPVNDIPVVTTQVLTLSEGNTRTISNTLLRATDPDNTASQLRYTLNSTPTNGFLLLNGVTLAANQTFSQLDINNGSLSYRHNGSESTNDSFNFVVSDGSGITSSTRFTIQVTPVNDVPILVSRGPLTLNEGAEVTINNTILRTIDPDGPQPLTYSLTSVPTTGTLRLGSTVMTIGSRFTQQDIDFGQLSYEHDGNEVFEDVFTFAVSDNNFTTTPISSFLRILVNPVNDAPRLFTNAGLTIDGTTQNTVTPLGAEVLQVTDQDTPDQNLVYTLTSVPDPSVGVLRLNGTNLSAGQTFTQEDINFGRISFFYFSGGFSENFQFTVSDGSGGFIGTSFFNIFFDYTGS